MQARVAAALLKRPRYNFVNLWQSHRRGSHTARRRSSARVCICLSGKSLHHTGKHLKITVFLFSQIYDSQEENISHPHHPTPVFDTGERPLRPPRKSGGKPLMDKCATTPGPQHLAPLSLLLHKNNNKQVADLPSGFATVFPTVGAVDAEKFPFFCMHI